MHKPLHWFCQTLESFFKACSKMIRLVRTTVVKYFTVVTYGRSKVHWLTHVDVHAWTYYCSLWLCIYDSKLRVHKFHNVESKFLRKIVNCFNHNFTFRAKSINNLLVRLKSWHSKSVRVEQNRTILIFERNYWQLSGWNPN